MFRDMLPVLENNMMSNSGAIPVVFDGIEHILEKNTPVSEGSKHTTHELLYLREGQIEFVIENKKLTLNKGNTLIIRPHMTHTLKITSPQADMLILYFGFARDPQMINEIIKENQKTKEFKDMISHKIPGSGPSVPLPAHFAQSSIESFLEFAEDGKAEMNKDPFIIISGSSKKDISQIVERIIEEMNSNMYSKDLMVKIMTVELMITLAREMRREWEESLRVKNGKAKELVLVAKKYIDDNFERGITVADAASYVFLSQGYFTRAFRDEIGISPMGYLMKIRIEKACELLEDQSIKISGVASQAGFSSPQRFNVAFRKQMGMTPMEYRKAKNF